MSPLESTKGALRALLLGLGYRLSRVAAEERNFQRGYDDSVALPADAATELRSDHPRLRALEQRYARFDSPLCRHTQWRAALRSSNDDLRWFRGETAYLWQYLVRDHRPQTAERMRLRYYIYARYLRDLDWRSLLGPVLGEDGRFGCFVFRYHEMPPVSRDLLDSVNELYFLDRHWDLFERAGARVLDIGAGYGRLAHRMLVAVPGVARYTCIDAVPRSTFLSEYYLRHRGLLGGARARARVVPLDEIDMLAGERFDLALNIHSFSEMSHEAIAAWLARLAQLAVPWLLVVPNEPQMLSREADGSRRGFRRLIEDAGYRLVATEPTVRDADVRTLYGAHDHFFLFQRG